ncbi:hypothetical protein BDAP_001464 [Binucleata daphniae]
MKINVKKLSIQKTPEYATNTGTIDLQPETNLERTWNYLANYYTSLEDEKEISQLKKLFESFYFAGTEIKTCKNTFDLVKQKIIKQVKIKKIEETNEYTLKEKVLNDLIDITNRKKRLLLDSIEKENKTYELVKNENVYIKNNRLKIWIDLKHKLDCTLGTIKKPEKWKSLGLYCCIQYRNITFEGLYKKNDLSCVEDVKEYIKETRLEGKYKINEFSVTIKRGANKKIAKENDLCKFVMACIDNNTKKEMLHEMMLCYTAKYLLNAFLRAIRITKYTIVSDTDKVMYDKLNNTFFCICDKGVIKICRSDERILMFMNERQIEYKM